MFLCPICKGNLLKENNSFKCPQGHCFDIAKSGYVNLLNPGKMNNAKAGDSKEMMRARTDFFECGAYSKIKDTLCEIVYSLNGKTIIDAGSGDGYYTLGLAKSNTSSIVLGFDMSKFGCDYGAKTAKLNNIENLHFSVGNIFDLPIKNEYADIIVSLFAPVANEEFLRVLRDDGYLIVVSAGIDHLDGLKRALYDKFYPNEEKFLKYYGFELQEVKNLKYEVNIVGNKIISSLFTMTPYYHRTNQTDKEKLQVLETLSTTVEVNFLLYKKMHI